MYYAVIAVRAVLGLAFTVFGLEFFLHFLNMSPPADMPDPAKSMMAALFPTGYLTVVKVLEVTGGILLLTGFFAPLGLVILTPIIVNITLYDHLLMGKPGLGLPFLVMAIFLIWGYRAYFAPLFTVNAKPGSCCRS